MNRKLFLHIVLVVTLVGGSTQNMSAMQSENQDHLERQKSLRLLGKPRQRTKPRTLYDKNLPSILKAIYEEARQDKKIKRELEGPDWSAEHRTLKSFDIIDGQPVLPPHSPSIKMEKNPSLLLQGLVWCVNKVYTMVPETDHEREQKEFEQNFNTAMSMYASKLIECFGSAHDQKASSYNNTLLCDLTSRNLTQHMNIVESRLEKLKKLYTKLATLQEPAIMRALESLTTFIARNEATVQGFKLAAHKIQQEQFLALAQRHAEQEEKEKTYPEPISENDLQQMAILAKKWETVAPQAQ